ADHGRTVEAEALGTVPASHLAWAPAAGDCDDEIRAIPARFSPVLAETPLTQARPFWSRPVASVTATTTLTDDLDAGLFSAAVQQLLQGAGLVLSGGAVSVQGGDGAWSVSDGIHAYRL